MEVVRLAKEPGLSLTGPGGLLKQLTKTVLETALAEEMTEHLGYEKHDPAGASSTRRSGRSSVPPAAPTARRASPSTCGRPGGGSVKTPSCGGWPRKA